MADIRHFHEPLPGRNFELFQTVLGQNSKTSIASAWSPIGQHHLIIPGHNSGTSLETNSSPFARVSGRCLAVLRNITCRYHAAIPKYRLHLLDFKSEAPLAYAWSQFGSLLASKSEPSVVGAWQRISSTNNHCPAAIRTRLQICISNQLSPLDHCLIAIREWRWLLPGSHSARHLPPISRHSRISLTAAWSSFVASFAAA